ncbi:MAG: hypothetical protein Q4C86_11460 [bacterium]|nr:hypothetical protein [bacterium]
MKYFTFFAVASTPIMNYRSYYRYPYGKSIFEDRFLRREKSPNLIMSAYITSMQYAHLPIITSCAAFGVFIFDGVNVPVSYSKVVMHALFCSMMILFYVENFLFVLTYVGFLSSSPKIDTQINKKGEDYGIKR